jgi:hypothetical protein
MSYTAKILSSKKQADKWKVVVRFSNGDKSIEKSYLLNPMTEEQAKSTLRSKIAELESFDLDVFPFPINKELDLTSTKPEVKPKPTAEEIAQSKWINAYYQLQKYQSLASAGVISDDHADILNTKKFLKDNYLVAYADFI